MKKQIRHSFVLGLMVIAALFSLFPTSVFAVEDSARLTPATGTSQTGNTFIISVDGYASHGQFCFFYCVETDITGVTGSLKFPSNLLKVTNIDKSNATFTSSTVTPNNNTGKITFNQSGTARNQTVHLFTITFESLAVGEAAVTFDNVTYGGSYYSTAATGGTYTIVAPPSPTPPPSSSPSPSPHPSTSPKPSATPKPSPTPKSTPTPEQTPAPVAESNGGLKIENVRVTANRQENSVAWTVNSPEATPTFRYGTSKNKLDSDTDVVKQADGSYGVSMANLKPGTLYYFMIIAATNDSLQGANYTGTLTTRGYPVQLTIKQNNLMIPNSVVKIGDRTFIANSDAVINTELSDGQHKALITPPGSKESFSAPFTVVKKPLSATGSPELQAFVLNVTTIGKSSGTNSSLILPLAVGGIIAVATIGGFVGFMLYRRRSLTNNGANADSDLLAATYGDAIEKYRTNTPAPNLDTVNIPQLGTQLSGEEAALQGVPSLDNSTPPPLPAMESSVLAPTPAPEPYPTPPITDPASISPPPLSNTIAPAEQPVVSAPQLEPNQPQVQTQTQAQEPASSPTVAPAGYSEDEQLSPELTQVEASQQIEPVQPSNDPEPSAVYDETTGELAILHHHTPHDIDTATQPGQITEQPTEVPPSDSPAAGIPSQTVTSQMPQAPPPPQSFTVRPQT